MRFSHARRFRIIRRIGSRCVFTLYEALDRKLDRLVFLKLFQERVLRKHSKRLIDTLRVASALEDPRIYKIYDYGFTNRRFFVALEVAYGRPLSRIMYDGAPLPFETLIGILSALSLTLRTAHLRGLIHGFLNPNCIFLEPDGRLKVDDFGLYWLSPYLPDAEFHSLYPYLAPEVYERIEEVDLRVDTYSIGALLSEAMSCYFPNATFTSAYGGLSEPPNEVHEIVHMCLQKNPNLRYVNTNELNKALNAVRKGERIATAAEQ